MTLVLLILGYRVSKLISQQRAMYDSAIAVKVPDNLIICSPPSVVVLTAASHVVFTQAAVEVSYDVVIELKWIAVCAISWPLIQSGKVEVLHVAEP